MDPGAARFSLLPVMSILLLQPEAQAADGPPDGCGASILPLYYKLCDLSAVWGVVVEALAAAGVVLSFILLVVLLASLPFVTDSQRRSSVGIQASFLLCTMGLFGLAFAFVMGRNFTTCTARQLLFGVLFAGCFACLLMQGVRLNLLARRDKGPPGWVLCLGTLGLWLVEAIINVEWLVLTMSFPSANSTTDVPVPCPTSNQDFTMALIYVMVLLLTSLIGAVSALIGKRRQWLKECTFLLATASISLAIWVVWLTMYIHWNDGNGNSSWDDPTLAIALVINAWVFLTLSSFPQICMLTDDHTSKLGYGESLYSNTEVTYENTVKEQKAVGVSRTPYENLYMENKAFSMNEPSPGRRPTSPYSNWSRSSIYQPTALALITKGPPNKDLSYDALTARVTANPQVLSRSPSAAPQNQTLPGI
ncbi:G-protein coupled receptor family C group 5 member C-like [Paramormyrops kingsleyae]|uniref:G-protein coupled receptor family C group 5 member C-like n=1 Tax=Paramormyrops kingsleyae TaxID=1676925 RepID=UPI003B96BA32